MAVIVTAEDDADVREMTARFLRRAGHTVIATADGAEGLAAVRKHGPDALITDADMPHMNGLELCRAIREDPQLRHTPVLMVTGSIDIRERCAADAGVTTVMSKPFTTRDLLQRLDGVLKHPAQRTAH